MKFGETFLVRLAGRRGRKRSSGRRAHMWSRLAPGWAGRATVSPADALQKTRRTVTGKLEQPERGTWPRRAALLRFCSTPHQPGMGAAQLSPTRILSQPAALTIFSITSSIFKFNQFTHLKIWIRNCMQSCGLVWSRLYLYQLCKFSTGPYCTDVLERHVATI